VYSEGEKSVWQKVEERELKTEEASKSKVGGWRIAWMS